ncbi:MAG: TetR/AcrR family transcriptional regulator [Candidatus Eremiobacteraeota bacterium]|nr:TetR/AcrR family transcriptional regulator [Candidatus Eremiobacteraeota bacterium]MBC5804580.1 TetR/AcrR family transcriptional regulator [Candidatus Eremiobacteraeota bacterium]MBC5822792.1 TetR/AcrR family transcriptional regulator [Candidatus Eremiobacteraeota bacterium]
MARSVLERDDVIPLVAEVFRELGYEGASLNEITERTGIGKGSLYHFFPGGKEQMAAEILDHVDKWFVEHVFEPLERGEPCDGIANMWQSVDSYFGSGRRICLIGAFALDETRDRFAARIRTYFARWIEALRGALTRTGVEASVAGQLAEEIVGGIQGALVLTRGLGDGSIFSRSLERLARGLTPLLEVGDTGQVTRSLRFDDQRSVARRGAYDR